MKKTIKPLWITRNAATGKIEGISTKKPTASALARLGEPVEIEITTRPPRQTEMEFVRDTFALVPTYSLAPTRTMRADARQQAFGI